MLTPVITLDDLYSPDTLYAALPYPGQKNWIPDDPLVRIGLSGNSLVLAGRIPLLVEHSFCDLDILKMFKGLASGFSQNPLFIAYHPPDILSALRNHVKKGGKICTPHRYPDSILRPEDHVFDPQLLSDLNNKRHLPRWAGKAPYPGRKVVKLQDLQKERTFPCVVKALTDWTSGGGADIHICHNRKNIEQALVKFASEYELLVEQWIPEARIFCVQGAVLRDGTCRYLGSTEQICDSGGEPLHNWIDPSSTVTAQCRRWALDIFQRAAAEGYRGIAGLDILKDAAGNFFLIDLNFRTCFSTPPLAYYPSLLQEWKHPCWSVRPLATSASKARVLDCVTKGISEQAIMPRQIQQTPAGWNMVLTFGGANRPDVEDKVAEFTRQLH